MGKLIEFPERRPGDSYRGRNAEPATVIILPVIRIDRPLADEQRLRKVVKRKRGNPRKNKVQEAAPKWQ